MPDIIPVLACLSQCREKALYRAVTPPFPSPPGDPAHGHPPTHGQQGLDYPCQLTSLGGSQTLAETRENLHNVDHGRLLLG